MANDHKSLTIRSQTRCDPHANPVTASGHSDSFRNEGISGSRESTAKQSKAEALQLRRPAFKSCFCHTGHLCDLGFWVSLGFLMNSTIRIHGHLPLSLTPGRERAPPSGYHSLLRLITAQAQRLGSCLQNFPAQMNYRRLIWNPGL